MFILRFKKVIVKFINNMVYDLGAPKNLTYFWKFGSLLGMFLVVQVLSGLFLTFFYISDINISFLSVDSISREIFYGWFMRLVHSNGASMFFLLLYLHIGRGFYYYSFVRSHLWLSGCGILVISMGIAFLGYVLPWGQMSYWGSVVITNLFSVLPFIGDYFVCWLWGGFTVCGPTLTRFFSLHFLLPLMLVFLVFIHFMLLHEFGSKNSLKLFSGCSKIKFSFYFIMKDLYGLFFVLLFFFFLVFYYPYLLMDPEKFLEAKSLSTPQHIQPEWYFLPAYAVLRSMPKKSIGVCGLFLFVFIFFFLPFYKNFKIKTLYKKIFFWFWVKKIFLLGFYGSSPVEVPYMLFSQMSSFIYFSYFFYEFNN